MDDRTPETDPNKRCLYFPDEMLQEIRTEAIRLDRSLSWVVQQAWRISRQGIQQTMTYDDLAQAPPPLAPTRVPSSPTATQVGQRKRSLRE